LESAVEEAWPSLEGRVERLEPAVAEEDDLLAVHTAEHLESIRGAWRIARERQVLVGLDSDTRVSPGSWDAALTAAGSAVAAAQAVGRGVVRNAFVAARPPGHHATPELAMGFCLFNNVAVAARSLQNN